MTLDDKVKEALGEISKLTFISNSLNKAKTPEEKGNLYLSAAQTMGGQEGFLEALNELKVNEGVAYAKIKNASKERVDKIKEHYDSNKNEILNTVEEKLNQEIRGAENKYDAVNKIAKYFIPLTEIPEIDQYMADKLKAQDLAERLQMNLITEARGSINESRQIYLRAQIADYVKEQESNGTVRYSVDKEKLKGLIDNIEAGAFLYTTTTNKYIDDYVGDSEKTIGEKVKAK